MNSLITPGLLCILVLMCLCGVPRGVSEPRVRMKQRVRAVGVRSELIRVLPPSQRGILVADAVASLWIAGGTPFGVRQLQPMSSKLAGALRGSVAKRYGKRARVAEHLFGPGVHRTLPPAAYIYTFCLQFTRLVSMARLDVFRLANLWTYRAQRLGCVHGMVEACRAIAVNWCAPCELSAESATFNFSPVESHYSVPFEVGEFVHATCERASWMSNLRSFLRLAVSRFMSLVRPRDHGSLTGGMVDDPMWRHALCSVMHRQSGPSLLCAGQWSKMGLAFACLAEDGLCPRCKEAPENLMHRLWSWWANEQYRVQLNSLVPAAVSFPDSLAHTLARTGIPRAGWDVLSLEEFKCLVNFLWCCAADGTTALAREYREMLEAPPFAFDRVQAEKSMTGPFSVHSVLRCLCRGRRGHGAAKHLVLLSLLTLRVATCMWTAAMSLLRRTLLRIVVGEVCTLCVQMLFKGNFAVPFSVVWCVITLVSSNCLTISQSWLRLFTLWSLSCLSPQVSIS